MGKIVLYYKYVQIKYPKNISKWQTKICQDLGLKGRIIIAHEGINGTLGGDDNAIAMYCTIMQKHPLFSGMDFKESPGSADCFPRLAIKVRNEIVSLGIDPQLITAEQGGTHVSPQDAHRMMTQSDNLVILDARNTYESSIGSFKNSVLPDISCFRELPAYLDNNIELFKDKNVLMACTGGVRCERASAYLKSKGVAQHVYQLSGGIHKYLEAYPDGHFAGKNYVFDARITLAGNNDILTTCHQCVQPCDEYNNCLNARCNKRFICCSSCLSLFEGSCSTLCKELIATHQVPQRPAFKKIVVVDNKATKTYE